MMVTPSKQLPPLLEGGISPDPKGLAAVDGGGAFGFDGGEDQSLVPAGLEPATVMGGAFGTVAVNQPEARGARDPEAAADGAAAALAAVCQLSSTTMPPLHQGGMSPLLKTAGATAAAPKGSPAASPRTSTLGTPPAAAAGSRPSGQAGRTDGFTTPLKPTPSRLATWQPALSPLRVAQQEASVPTSPGPRSTRLADWQPAVLLPSNTAHAYPATSPRQPANWQAAASPRAAPATAVQRYSEQQLPGVNDSLVNFAFSTPPKAAATEHSKSTSKAAANTPSKSTTRLADWQAFNPFVSGTVPAPMSPRPLASPRFGAAPLREGQQPRVGGAAADKAVAASADSMTPAAVGSGSEAPMPAAAAPSSAAASHSLDDAFMAVEREALRLWQSNSVHASYSQEPSQAAAAPAADQLSATNQEDAEQGPTAHAGTGDAVRVSGSSQPGCNVKDSREAACVTFRDQPASKPAAAAPSCDQATFAPSGAMPPVGDQQTAVISSSPVVASSRLQDGTASKQAALPAAGSAAPDVMCANAVQSLAASFSFEDPSAKVTRQAVAVHSAGSPAQKHSTSANDACLAAPSGPTPKDAPSADTQPAINPPAAALRLPSEASADEDVVVAAFAASAAAAAAAAAADALSAAAPIKHNAASGNSTRARSSVAADLLRAKAPDSAAQEMPTPALSSREEPAPKHVAASSKGVPTPHGERGTAATASKCPANTPLSKAAAAAAARAAAKRGEAGAGSSLDFTFWLEVGGLMDPEDEVEGDISYGPTPEHKMTVDEKAEMLLARTPRSGRVTPRCGIRLFLG